MSWASRATLIFAILWTVFWVLVCGPASNPYAFSKLWWYGMSFVVGLPVGLVFLILVLALGDRGAVYRDRPRPGKPRKPGFLKDANGRPVYPLQPHMREY